MALTVAQLQARKETVMTKLAELDDLLDTAEDGTSIQIVNKRDSFLKELEVLDKQIAAVNLQSAGEQSAAWLGLPIRDQYIEEGL